MTRVGVERRDDPHAGNDLVRLAGSGGRQFPRQVRDVRGAEPRDLGVSGIDVDAAHGIGHNRAVGAARKRDPLERPLAPVEIHERERHPAQARAARVQQRAVDIKKNEPRQNGYLTVIVIFSDIIGLS